MESLSRITSRNSSDNTKRPAWMFAIAILLLGALLGYLLRGTSSSTESSGSPNSNQPAGSTSLSGPSASLEATVRPLLNRLKDSPNDPELLANIGNAYYDSHDYSMAVDYYEQSLKLRPEDADVRTDMGTAIWYSGNADRAIREYQTSLQYQPNHAQTLFNMGIVEWQGKHQGSAALQLWQQLLATDPAYPDRKKVEQLMQQVETEIARSTGRLIER